MTDKLYLWLVSIFVAFNVTFTETVKEGISHAISRGYLDSARLSIILDKRRPNHIVESYSFAFTYNFETSAQASSSLENPVALAREDLFRLVRHLGSFCQTLPHLPC